MRKFETHYGEIEPTEGHFCVSGRNIGNDAIRIGDSLGGLTVDAIEAYGRQLSECSPGLTAKITLRRPPISHGGRYDLPLMLMSPDAEAEESN